MIRVLVVALVVSGCANTATKQCGDFTCSESSVCAPDGSRCVTPSQLESCQGKANGDGCSFPGTDVGVCDTDVCVAAGCGNGVIETASNEICDDGNRSSGDGCSANCQSLEKCGDGVTDFSVGEPCDCGIDPDALPFGCNGINSMAANATCRPLCTLGRCGDTVLDAGEQCDDGNNVAGDGCRADCGGRWTILPSGTLALISSVWATSTTDAWATAGGHVLHWNGIAWTDATPPGGAGSFIRVWGLSANDVFVLGLSPTKIWRHTNGAWQDKTPLLDGSAWSAIHATGNELWVLGEDSVNKFPYATHWNGSSFDTPLQGGFQLAEPPVDAYVASSGDIYFIGDNGGSQPSTYARYANGNWNVALGSRTLDAISGTSPTDIFGFGGTGGAHWNGTSWTTISESNYFAVRAVHSIPGVTLAAGSRGNVLTCTATACSPLPTNQSNDLFDVFVLSDKEAFVVGEYGTILY